MKRAAAADGYEENGNQYDTGYYDKFSMQHQSLYHDEQKGGFEAFGFGSADERKFNNPLGKHSGTQMMMEQKQMFTNLLITIFIPKDPQQITAKFNLIDTIEDNFEQLEKLEYHCEAMNYSTAEAILLKSLEHFNQQLKEQGKPVRFAQQDVELFQMRIGKKKNGKPNTDYPKIDLTQNIVDVDFTNFCIVYQPAGILCLLDQRRPSAQTNSAQKKKGIMKKESSKDTRSSLHQTRGYEEMTLQKCSSTYQNSNQTQGTQGDDLIQNHSNSHKAAELPNVNQQACCGGRCTIF